ncbi:MAG: hypothetical protein LQ351_000872 [Letrouitia transgressa]|nr:MAG: hypothetical protein LQ351_000872 [Letrouitia transgressa]
MSPPTSSLPVIDISPFLSPHPVDPSALKSCARSLDAACTSPGFFYLTNHNLPPALAASVLDLARRFFTTVPDAEKQRIRRRDVGDADGDGARGYQVIGDNITQGKRDWHEGIDWYRPVRAGEPHLRRRRPSATADQEVDRAGDGDGENVPAARSPPYTLLRGLNQWPARPEGFRGVYESYVAHMLALGAAVVRAMGVALGGGTEGVLAEATRDSWWVMRAIGYPPLPAGGGEGEGRVSCGAHTDYGCVTLLLADETPGALQVWVDGRWIGADPRPGALVVNIGDMMERWSGGRWKSTRHRVVHRGKGYRVSVPFFFEPDFEAKVPGKEGEGEVVYGEYLMQKVRGNF